MLRNDIRLVERENDNHHHKRACAKLLGIKANAIAQCIAALVMQQDFHPIHRCKENKIGKDRETIWLTRVLTDKKFMRNFADTLQFSLIQKQFCEAKYSRAKCKAIEYKTILQDGILQSRFTGQDFAYERRAAGQGILH